MDYGQKFMPNGVFGMGGDGLADPIYLSPGTVTSTMLGFITGATSNIQTQINALMNGKSYRGEYNASTNLFPATGGSGTGGAINAGDTWDISAAGTLGGVPVVYGDQVR